MGANNNEIRFAENELKVIFPEKYKQFLSECGMCNFGDTRINGIFKIENKIEFPIIENTLYMRLSGLENDFIVLDFQEHEYLTLYKVSEKDQTEDGLIYGAEVRHTGSGNMKFNSFDDYFNNFMESGI